MSKPLSIMLVVGLVTMMILTSVVSMASAQQSGTIASIQTGPNRMPAWILSGGWDFKNINSSSPDFNSTFLMVTLNGAAPHIHTVTNFKMTGSPTKSSIAATYNGTATFTAFSHSFSVPISIKIMGRAMSLWIGDGWTGHFGNTPIYGTV